MSVYNSSFTGPQIDAVVDEIRNAPTVGTIGAGVDPNGSVRAKVGSKRWDDDNGIEWMKRPDAGDDNNGFGTQGWFKYIELGWVNGSPP